MRRARSELVAVFVVSLGLLIGCEKPVRQVSILGHWQAERYDLGGISLPVGPEISVTPTSLRAWENELPIMSIEADETTAVLNTSIGIGLKFIFDSPDRMFFDVPFIGKVYYRRVSSPQSSNQKIAESASPPQLEKTPATPTKSRSLAEAEASRPVPRAADGVTGSAVARGGASDTAAVPNSGSATNQHIAISASGNPEKVNVLERVNTAGRRMPSGDSVIAMELIGKASNDIRAGRLDDARHSLLMAKARDPEQPLVHYSLTVLHAKQGRIDEAIDALRDASAKGFRAYELLERDPDLAGLLNHPRSPARSASERR